MNLIYLCRRCVFIQSLRRFWHVDSCEKKREKEAHSSSQVNGKKHGIFHVSKGRFSLSPRSVLENTHIKCFFMISRVLSARFFFLLWNYSFHPSGHSLTSTRTLATLSRLSFILVFSVCCLSFLVQNGKKFFSRR